MEAERTSPRSLPDRIADRLLEQIFTGTLRPGQKLPPERVLAQDLGVDRTSLRAALKYLQRLHLVDIVQGSGVTVRDYRTHGGIDFLAAVFSLPEVMLPGSFLVEVLDVWFAIMPEMMGQAFARASMEDYRSLMAVFDKQLKHLDDAETLAQLEVEAQDEVGRLVGNLVVILFFNSTRPIRLHMARTFYALAAGEEHVRAHRGLLSDVAAGRLPADQVAATYRSYLFETAAGLREALLSDALGDFSTADLTGGGGR